jgi:hypothetical protein
MVVAVVVVAGRIPSSSSGFLGGGACPFDNSAAAPFVAVSELAFAARLLLSCRVPAAVVGVVGVKGVGVVGEQGGQGCVLDVSSPGPFLFRKGVVVLVLLYDGRRSLPVLLVSAGQE